MTDRTRARVIGGLFVVASVAAIVGGAMVVPVEEAGTIGEITATDAGIVTGALIEVLMVVAVIGIAAMFFPVLKREDEGLAIGYLGVRMLEGGLLLAAAVSALVLVGLPGQATTADPGVLLAIREWTYLLGSLVALGVGALILYGLLWTSRVVPPWLSAWGLLGAVTILLRGLLEVYGVELSGWIQAVLAAPIALNEMVLAVWLVVKGFDTRVLVVPDVDRAAAPTLQSG